MLPAKKQRYKCTITDLTPADKTVTLADGSKIQYNKVRVCVWGIGGGECVRVCLEGECMCEWVSKGRREGINEIVYGCVFVCVFVCKYVCVCVCAFVTMLYRIGRPLIFSPYPFPLLPSPSYPSSPSFQLLTTIPLDITLKWVNQPTLSARLTYSSSHIIGLGLRGENPHDTYVLHFTYCIVLYRNTLFCIFYEFS